MARWTRAESAASFFCTLPRRRRKQAQSRRLLLCDRHTHTYTDYLQWCCSHRIEIINQIKIFHFQMICGGAVCLFMFLLCERITQAVLFNWMPDCVLAVLSAGAVLSACVFMLSSPTCQWLTLWLSEYCLSNSVVFGSGWSIRAVRGSLDVRKFPKCDLLTDTSLNFIVCLFVFIVFHENE